MNAQHTCPCQRLAIGAWMAVAGLLVTPTARADGAQVDTVYHPYVQPLERDVELRLVSEQHGQARDDGQTWRLGYGQSFSARGFAELYLIADRPAGEDLRVRAYELETRWQLTEQGQYAADWGLMGEFEHARDRDAQEFAATLLGERQWGRFVGTMNASLGYEWGDDVHSEVETRLALQGAYRYSPRLQPAVEFHAGQDLRALGPALLGTERLGIGRKLHWEAGLAFGLDAASPDVSVRGKLEYEF
jgi:hypothetical protein